MRTVITISIILFFHISAGAASKIVRNPSWGARNTTTMSIDSIEIKENLTRIYATCRHLPNHWMIIHSDIYIADPVTKQEWKAFEIDGTDFDRKFQVSNRGTANISIDFPPLPQNVKTFDLYEKSGELPIRIVDISLQNKTANIKSTGKYQKNTFSSSAQDTIFKPDILVRKNAVLKGYISDFHPRLQFGNGTIYLDNVITKEQKTISVNINNDGTFCTVLPLDYPVQQTLFFPSGYVNFYIEPGDSLFIETSMEDLTIPFKTPEEIEQRSKHTRYSGNLSRVNDELKKIRVSSPANIQETASDILILPPITFKEKYTREFHQKQEELKNWLKAQNISPKASEIALINQTFAYARLLLDYETYHSRRASNDKSIPEEYYQFLKPLPLVQDKSLIAADYKLFINRLELSAPLMEARQISAPDLINSFTETGINLKPDEKELVLFSMQMKSLNDTVNFKNYAARMTDFNKKYALEQIRIRENIGAKNLYRIYVDKLGLKPGITLDLLYTRKFIPRLTSLKRKLTPDEFQICTRYIGHPALKKMMNELNSAYDPGKAPIDTQCNLR